MSSTKFEIKAFIFPGQHIRNYPGATRHSEETTQYLEAKQYIPLNNRRPQDGDITIIGTPAISFPKELYEPLWDGLLEQAEHCGFHIRSIWSVDACNQGKSGILNEHTQGDEPTWFDFSRDLIHMINLFRDEMPQPLVGIGHSMGATSFLELARLHPRLISTLVLFDPVIGDISSLGFSLIYMSSIRRDIWHSREEAERDFRTMKSLQKWDPRVFDLWMEHGLRETPTLLYPQAGKVTLATTKANESWYYGRSFFDPLPPDGVKIGARTRAKYPDFHPSIESTHPFYRAEMDVIWRDMPNLRPGCLYVFPQKGPMTKISAMERKHKQTGCGSGGSGGESEGRVAKVVVPDTGHLLPFEKPAECAKVAAAWIGKELMVWTEMWKLEREHRDDKSVNQVALSKKWMREAKLNFEKAKMRSKAKL